MGTLQIDILGTSFAIQAKEDTAYLENLLAYYKQVSEQIEKNTGLSDPIKQAILTGIMLCDELYKEKKKNSETLYYQRFGVCGISRTRTYDPHDVNVVL